MNNKERKAMQNTGNEPSMVGKEQRYSEVIGLTGVHNVPEVGLIVSLGRQEKGYANRNLGRMEEVVLGNIQESRTRGVI